METVNLRKPASFRLDSALLDALKQLAKEKNKSLNKYVEGVLAEAVHHEPNRETIAAIQEARSGKELETLDLDNFKTFVNSL